MCFEFLKSCSCICSPQGLPMNFQVNDFLGAGHDGFVMGYKKGNQTLAAKISRYRDFIEEIKMTKILMKHNLHQYNIVKYVDWLTIPTGPALLMERLDITICQYDMICLEPLSLSDIRDIIKQMAIALDALKSIGVIQGDIDLDNIMMVDHRTRPFRVKLIDFGMAKLTSQTVQGMCLQNPHFRAPEVIVGAPFTEAIDMWSLGCVMGDMLYRGSPFGRSCPTGIMQAIVYHCGQPPDHVLNSGLYTEDYFIRTESGWKIKERLSHEFLNCRLEGDIDEGLCPTDKPLSLEALQCLDLLRAMLRVDPAERITPAEVLVHPFIVKASASAPEHTDIGRDRRRPLCKVPLSRYLPVEPAEAGNTLESWKTTSDESMTSESGFWTFTSDTEDLVERNTTNIRRAHRSPSPSIPPFRTIHVQPAAAENTSRLEDQEDTDSLVIHISKTSSPVSWTSTSDSEDRVTAPKERETTNIRPAHRSPSPTIPPSLVIYIQPATAENTLRSEDQESLESLQAGLKNTPESAVTITENDTTLTEDDSTFTDSDSTASLTSEDFTSYGKKQLPQSPPPVTDLASKKKKKKNCFQRFFSWMKKTFCSCMTVVDDD